MMNTLETLKGKIKNRLIDYGINGIRNRAGRRVIMYHGIDRIQNGNYNARFISVKTFEEQIIYFKKHFQIISLEDYFKGNTTSNAFEIAITFDDGLKNNFDYALPVLEKHQVPATFFITAMNKSKEQILWSDFYDIAKTLTNKDFEFSNVAFKKELKSNKYYSLSGKLFQQVFKEDQRPMDEKMEELITVLLDSKNDFRKKKEFDDYWKLMSDDEIKKTSESKYVTIGSHGMYHNNLGLQDLSKSITELKMSKSYLENLTDYEIKSIGYPDGSYTRELIEEAFKIGYKRQCAVSYLFEEDKKDNRIIDRYGISALKIPENVYRVAYNIVKPF